jgi:putative sigma-54 modulation protein
MLPGAFFRMHRQLKNKEADYMKFIIRGKNIEVTQGLKDIIERKLGKLDKYFTPDTEVYVTLSVEKESQIMEVTIPVKSGLIRSEQSSSDMYVTIDLVEEVIERQLRKYRTKLIAKNHGSADFKEEFIQENEEHPEDDQEIKIIRTKKFGFKPMYPEDACIQMELLGHNFYVFCNAESEEVNVVYKRKDGTYGLIEPEF